MRTSSSELKRRARQALKGRYGLCVGAQCILFGIVFVIAMIYMGVTFYLEFVGGLESGFQTMTLLLMAAAFIGYMLMLSLPSLLAAGLVKLYLNLSTKQPTGLSDLLFPFENRPWRFLGLYFVDVGIGLLWGIPYIVVFVVALITEFMPVMVVLLAAMYLLWLFGAMFTMLYLGLAIFILVDYPEKGVFQSLKESAAMMKGNKGRLFYIYISFIGILLLGYASLGIGFLWGFPYIQCTQVQFYLDLKAEQEPAPQDDFWEDASFERM